MAASDDRSFDALATGAVTSDVRSTPADAVGTSSRFAPGAIIAGRYRMVALLGRGGMGEVFRADDLTLDHPVALKFLPAAGAPDEARLSRFHNELRVARQVSHKNVCRVYDLGEVDGHRFLTMEYVDGEDLATLLRRIGRIPHDKAVQMARQLCAGVAAAHDRGVLHRDLKPANVMIDGEGDVRITDFGIATASANGTGEFIGTPQYMAPEQFAGEPASLKSDIYALGLILFEVFTGRRAHESHTLEALREFHQSGTLPTPSSIVRDLDPAVERIILRCLDRNPGARPATALAVAAALPGADPLADALAAGETPAPTLLAAAGKADALGVLPGIVLLGASVVGMLVFAWWSPQVSTVGRTPLDPPPAVLVDRATQLIRTLGYTDEPGDEAYQYRASGDYLNWIQRTRRTPQRWDVLPTGYPSAIQFWYRTSPGELLPSGGAAVTHNDPPLILSGMQLVVMDSTGRLLEFRAVPIQVEEDPDLAGGNTSTPPWWPPLFEAAGLDVKTFTPTVPQWTPMVYADTRLAWDGPMPGGTKRRLHIDAAAFRGRPVSFLVVGPWTQPQAMRQGGLSTEDLLLGTIIATVILAFILMAVVLVRRHLHTGRADVSGATRLSLGLSVPLLAAWALRAHHAWAYAEFANLLREASRIVFLSVVLWTIYVALEPYVRRFWPHGLLGWSRVLAGHLRDSRVGRDVLLGVLFGVALALSDVVRATLFPWLGYPAPRVPFATRVDILSGAGPLVAAWIEWVVGAVQYSLLSILIVVVLRLVLPWSWLALVVTSLLLGVASWTFMLSSSWWLWAFPILPGALLTLVAVRFGLLALVVAWFTWSALYGVPMTVDVSHWAATASNWTLALLIGLAAFGFYASRAGQPLFGRILRE